MIGDVVKAIDNHGRISLTFAVHNPHWAIIDQEAGIHRSTCVSSILFTIFQRYRNEGLAFTPSELKWCHRWAEQIPSNDGRFLYDYEMNDEK